MDNGQGTTTVLAVATLAELTAFSFCEFVLDYYEAVGGSRELQELYEQCIEVCAPSDIDWSAPAISRLWRVFEATESGTGANGFMPYELAQEFATLRAYSGYDCSVPRRGFGKRGLRHFPDEASALFAWKRAQEPLGTLHP